MCTGSSPLVPPSNIDTQKLAELPATRFVPLYNKIAVRRHEVTEGGNIFRGEGGEKTKGGIIIPDTAVEKPRSGTVAAVGGGLINPHDPSERLPLTVKVGDTVYFGKYAGSEIEIDGEVLLIVSEEELLGLIGSGPRPQ